MEIVQQDAGESKRMNGTTRREFVKLAGAAAASVALLPEGLAARDGDSPTAAGARKPRKKGIMYGAVRGDMPVMDKLKLIKEAGFDGVEMMSGMDQTEVLKARDTTGLEISSVCDSVHWDKTLSDPNPTTRELGVEGLKIALRDCKAYGGSSVLLVPAVVNKQVSYADAYTRSQAEIRKALPLAEELGIKIAFENVWNQFLLSPLEAARYVDEFKSPAAGWHFDVGNVINIGWPEQWIRILGSRIQKLHIKEYSRKKRDDEGLWKGFHVEYLEGDNDWPAVVNALDEVGYQGWAVAEPAWWPEGVDLGARLHQIVTKMQQIFG
jgi:L-ribulose-5-phosphate 3-epimerase